MSDDDRRALRAIEHHLRQAETDEADFAVTAQHILIALKALGFRQTNAGRHQPWQPPEGHGTDPTPEWADYRQALDRGLEAIRELREQLAQTEGTHAATGGQP